MPGRLWPRATAYDTLDACSKRWEWVLVAGHSGDELGGVVEEVSREASCYVALFGGFGYWARLTGCRCAGES